MHVRRGRGFSTPRGGSWHDCAFPACWRSSLLTDRDDETLNHRETMMPHKHCTDIDYLTFWSNPTSVRICVRIYINWWVRSRLGHGRWQWWKYKIDGVQSCMYLLCTSGGCCSCCQMNQRHSNFIWQEIYSKPGHCTAIHDSSSCISCAVVHVLVVPPDLASSQSQHAWEESSME